MSANRATHELDRLTVRKLRRVRRIAERRILRDVRLALGNRERLIRAWINWNVLPPSDPTERARHLRAFVRLARHRRNSQQFTVGLREQVGKRERVVDIASDISIKKHFDFCWR